MVDTQTIKVDDLTMFYELDSGDLICVGNDIGKFISFDKEERTVVVEVCEDYSLAAWAVPDDANIIRVET